MAETKPSSELAPHLDSCRWHIRDGAWLLTDLSTAALRRNLQVVALGGGTGLPVVLRGLKAELFPNGPACTSTGVFSSVWSRFGLIASRSRTAIEPAPASCSAVTGVPSPV